MRLPKFSRIKIVLFTIITTITLASPIFSQLAFAQVAGAGEHYEWLNRSTILLKNSKGEARLTYYDDELDYDHTYKTKDEHGCDTQIHVEVGDALGGGIFAPLLNTALAQKGELEYRVYTPGGGCGTRRKLPLTDIQKPEAFNITYKWLDAETITRTDDDENQYTYVKEGTHGSQTLFLRLQEQGKQCRDFLLANGDKRTGYFEELTPDSGEHHRHTKYPDIGGNCYIDEDGRENPRGGDIQIGDVDKAGEAPNPSNRGGAGTGSEVSQCQGSGVFGWIVCPMVGTLGFIVDKVIHEDFVTPLLKLDPLLSNQSGDTVSGAVYSAWKSFRNLANTFFIIVFFVIIISQATGAGLDAYSIRKMLPRLVVAAIAVQVSFYLAAALIDFTNILGAGVKGLIETPFSRLGGLDIKGDSFTQTLFSLGVVGGVAFAGAGLLSIVPLLIGSLLTLLIVLIVLAFRVMLIYLCVLLAPIAFVAWILPNTQSLFKTWWTFFFRALMMYPMIEALFAISKVLGSLVSKLTH